MYQSFTTEAYNRRQAAYRLSVTSGLPGGRPGTPRACGARKKHPVAQFTISS